MYMHTYISHVCSFDVYAFNKVHATIQNSPTVIRSIYTVTNR